jgi:hypothetical protein
MAIHIAYGIASFESLILQDYHYIDRTQYIETIEASKERHIAFLRPRRFGKSLFVNTLEAYYDVRQKPKFAALFGKTYIGKNPTPLANTYRILSFDFSGITTSTEEKAHKSFLQVVKGSVDIFLHAYFPNDYEDTLKKTDAQTEPSDVMRQLFIFLSNQNTLEKMYITIDEYDHFTNELISFSMGAFKNIVTKNGWMRKFYETIKIATSDSIVDRIFVTGVSPITLDSLTSGFNIIKQLSGDLTLHELMGFTATEVADIMLGVGAPPQKLPQIMQDLTNWYDGYLFSEEATTHLFNPDMVMYFASEYKKRLKYPRRMLDINVMSDYSKIRNLFKIGGQEQQRIAILEQLLQEGEVIMKMTDQFTFEKNFDNSHFVNMLYYSGALTIKGYLGDEAIFTIPNYVIKQLYFEYFSQILMDETDLNHDILGYAAAVRALVYQNDVQPLVTAVSTIMSKLSNRDSMQFGEKHLKSIFTTILMFSEVYYIHSELELERHYIDLFIERTSRFEIPFQFLFEFKYYSESKQKALNEKGDWAAELDKARTQLTTYKDLDYFKDKQDLKPWLFVFVGDTPVVVEEI